MEKRFPRFCEGPLAEAKIWTLKMAPVHIGYVNSIIEAYEGLGMTRTTDRNAGLVEVWVMPGFEPDFQVVLDSLAAEIPLEVVEKEGPVHDFPES